MKCIKKSWNWVLERIKRSPKRSICFLICWIGNMVFVSNIISLQDTTPATAKDFEPLENKIMAIQENQNLDSLNEGETFTLTFENEECSIIAEFDKNFQVVSSSKYDKAMSPFGQIIEPVFFAVLFFLFEYMILSFIIFLGKKVFSLFKKIFRKK